LGFYEVTNLSLDELEMEAMLFTDGEHVDGINVIASANE